MLSGFWGNKAFRDDEKLKFNELDALEKMRVAFAQKNPEVANDKDTLRRFLYARIKGGTQFDVNASIEMLRKTILWRARRLPVHLTDEVVTELTAGKFYAFGTDLERRPVIVLRSAMWHPSQVHDHEAAVSAIIYLVEKNLCGDATRCDDCYHPL